MLSKRLGLASVLTALLMLGVLISPTVGSAATGSGGGKGASVPQLAGPEPSEYCGSTAASECYFSWHITLSSCPDFGIGERKCQGPASSSMSGFGEGSDEFDWRPRSEGGVIVGINSGYNQQYAHSYLWGWLPGRGSGEFHVTEAQTYALVGRFSTLDLPGKKVGEKGGPLHIDVESGGFLDRWDYKVAINGWLHR